MSELAIESTGTGTDDLRDDPTTLIWTSAGEAAELLNKRLNKIAISGIGASEKDLLRQSVINMGYLIARTKGSFAAIADAAKSDIAKIACQIERFSSEDFVKVVNKVKSSSGELRQADSRQSVDELFNYVQGNVADTLALMYFIHLIEGSAFNFAKYACNNLDVNINKFPYFKSSRPANSLVDDFLDGCVDEFTSDAALSVDDIEKRITHLLKLADEAIRQTFLLKKFNETRDVAEAVLVLPLQSPSIRTAAAV